MTLQERIYQIPGEEGWFKSSGGKRFLELAEKLIAKGFTEDETVELLEDAYSIVSGEFGN